MICFFFFTVLGDGTIFEIQIGTCSVSQYKQKSSGGDRLLPPSQIRAWLGNDIKTPEIGYFFYFL